MKELLAARLLRLEQKAAKKRPRRTARKIAKKKKA
jgi:hypothetical protein